jgi:hypothetical protein
MDHPIYMSERDREGFENAILQKLEGLTFDHMGEEANFNPALVRSLDGLEFTGSNFHVSIHGTPMTSGTKHAAEPHVGADMSIGAEIWVGSEKKEKAVLIQAKRRSKLAVASERKRLEDQIKDMRVFTPHPKVLLIDDIGHGLPVIQSGRSILDGRIAREFEIHRWLARRFIRTFDGDQSPSLYEASKSPNLNKIWLKSEFSSKRKG